MNDNRVSISTELDNSGIEKGAREIKGELGGVEGVVNDVRDALRAAFSGDFDKSIANANARVNELKQKLATVSAALSDAIAADDDASAEKYGNQKVRIYDQLEAARERLANAVRAAAQKEAAAEIKAAEKATAAKKREEEKQYKEATKSARRFGSRFREIVSGALVFNLLSAGLREMTSYFGTALKSNEEFTKSFAQLKGALLTAFQPIYEVVLPALISLMRVLTAVAQVIGNFFAIITGKSSSQMAANAEALNKEASAISGVGGAAKKAKRQLAGFDEINKLNSTENSSGGGGGGSSLSVPNFETMAITDGLEHILYLIGAIAAALLTWKIASLFTYSLSLIAGLALSVGGAILYAFNIFDAFKEGIDWNNLTGMLVGMIALAGGLFLAFGAVGAGIGLIIAGVLTAVVAIREWIKTGELSTEACMALVAGILAIGGAIALFTGSWIPLVVAAVAALVVVVIKYWDEIRAVFSKVVSWIDVNVIQPVGKFFSQLATNIAKFAIDAVAGITKTFSSICSWLNTHIITPVYNGFKSLVNGIIGFINGMIRGVTSGINTVIKALNSIKFTVPNWIPAIGGKSVGFSLGYVSAPQIPMLAQGAVLPANKPFMAILGDQRHGTNIEAPLSTIQEAVALVMEEYSAANLAGHEATVAVLRDILEAVLGIEIGDEVLGKAVGRYNSRLATMRGDA